MGSFGFQELVVILLIVVVLFGARRIPELARGMGEGIRGFRASLRGGDDDESSKSDKGGEAPKNSGR